MKRWKVWVGLVVIFLSGITIGAVGTGVYVKRIIERVMDEDRGQAIHRFMLRRLTRELNLSGEQRQQIDAILSKTARELVALERETAPKVREIFNRSVCEMKEHLSGEQLEKLDSWIQEMRARGPRIFRRGGLGGRRAESPPRPPTH